MTTKTKKFTRTDAQAARSPLDKALADAAKGIEEATGFPVAISAGAIRFSDTGFTVKVTVDVVGDDGHVETREADAFRTMAGLIECSPPCLSSDLFKRFRFRSGDTGTIIGFNTRAPKFPILIDIEGRGPVKAPESFLNGRMEVC